jgi:hypothetical protein
MKSLEGRGTKVLGQLWGPHESGTRTIYVVEEGLTINCMMTGKNGGAIGGSFLRIDAPYTAIESA